MSIIDKPSDYFNTKLYTGTGSELAITGVGFQPDWVWTKSRSNTLNHNVYDAVRGVNKGLKPNTNDAEFDDAQSLKSFNSDGFTVGTDSHINTSSATFASWNWKAGTSFTNDASATGIGSIDSTGSVNTTSGFSIITSTLPSSGTVTIAHGLGVKPNVLITKALNKTYNWDVLHKSINDNGAGRMILNTTGALDTGSNPYASTTPTSSVFSFSADFYGASNIVAYCFAEKQGYSKFGSYTGNGNADGTFVYTGQKSAFIMIKRTDAAADWEMYDNKRLGFNDDNPPLYANLNNAEGSNDRIDILSNGFKIVTTSGNLGASGGTYIYMAFAESPFTNSGFVPNNAR